MAAAVPGRSSRNALICWVYLPLALQFLQKYSPTLQLATFLHFQPLELNQSEGVNRKRRVWVLERSRYSHHMKRKHNKSSWFCFLYGQLSTRFIFWLCHWALCDDGGITSLFRASDSPRQVGVRHTDRGFGIGHWTKSCLAATQQRICQWITTIFRDTPWPEGSRLCRQTDEAEVCSRFQQQCV